MDFQIYAVEVNQGRKKYVATLSLADAYRMIQLTEWNEIPPEMAPQRPQNRRHARAITEYIKENPETYNLPPLSLVVDKAVFRPMGNHPFGRLTISSDAKIYPIDGQHRLLAIRDLAASPLFKESEAHAIAVEIHVGLPLTARQDLFVTMNTTKKVSKQVIMAIGQNEEMRLARRIANEASGFIDLIEKSRSSVPKSSPQLFTLSQLYDAYMAVARSMLHDPQTHEINSNVEEAIVRASEVISTSIPTYRMVREGDLVAKETCLACDPFFLQSIFRAVFQVMRESDLFETSISEGLAAINWQKFTGKSINPLWEKFLLPLPLAKVIRTKENRDEISRIIIAEIRVIK